MLSTTGECLLELKAPEQGKDREQEKLSAQSVMDKVTEACAVFLVMICIFYRFLCCHVTIATSNC